MKILAIRLRNLNSLYGSWSIDLTAPEYVSSGIFAITGPTGAGKSTILDALCLALFARTPRLGHISKGSNEIMSRRAGDCFAEVDFETSDGAYRCHWAQHRARRSTDGELQSPKHELVDARNNTVLETRSKEVIRRVEQLTGMDYDRFTRSILLAQGEFAAFLQADADQRAPILEQITGTSIYSRISVAVHERTSEERKKTALCRESLGTITLLSEEEEQHIQDAIIAGTAQAAAMQHRLGQLDASLNRLAHIESLQQQLTETEQQLQALVLRKIEAREELARYARGQRAQTLLAGYSLYQQLHERINAVTAKIENLHPAIEETRQQQLRIEHEHSAASQQVQESTALQQKEFEIIKQVRALDLSWHEKKQQLNQRIITLRQKEAERQQLLQTGQQMRQMLREITGRLDQLATFFHEYAADSILTEQLAGFKQQIQQLETRETNLLQLTQLGQETQTQQASLQQQLAQLGQEEEMAAANLVTMQQQLQVLTAEHEAALTGLPVSAWRQRAEQESQRLQQLGRARELLTRQHSFAAELSRLEQALESLHSEELLQNTGLQGLEQTLTLQQQLASQCELSHQLALRMRNLQEERQHLAEGAPCPLCGSLQHPWAQDLPHLDTSGEALAKARSDLEQTRRALTQKRELLIALAKDREHHHQALASTRQQHAGHEQLLQPLMVQLALQSEGDPLLRLDQALGQSKEHLDTIHQRLHTIDQLENTRQRLQLQLQEANSIHAGLSRQLQNQRHAEASVSHELQRLKKQAKTEEQQAEQIRADLLQQLQPLGISQCLPGQASTLLARLEARLHTWKDRQKHNEQLDRQRQEIQTELDKQALLLTGIDSMTKQQTTELAGLKEEQAQIWAKRQALFGDRHPDTEEQRLQALVQQNQEREQLLRTRRHALDTQIHAQTSQLSIAEQERAELQEQSQTAATALQEQILAAGFTGLDDYRQALLPQDQLTTLARLHEELATTGKVLTARLEDRQQTLALAREEMDRHGDQQGREALQAEQEQVRSALAELQQRIGAGHERLANNLRRKEQQHEQRFALTAQEKELERWENLHLLIGSADGKKFRVFAQGLTFEVMINHANRQLRKMNDRYILLRDTREPLSLQVIDNYQAGEMRSTRNLSGGESFLVSLALSLGLSAMASHNVRVDSLFLDEGFGTLDEEALDTALQTLAELRQSGKLIGIISHVPALKDRIDTRIQVLPETGGNSRLTGPGCYRLA